MAKASHKPEAQAEETQNTDLATGESQAANTKQADPTPNDLGELVASSVKQVVSSASKAIDQPLRAPETPGVTTDELNNIDFHKLIGGPLQAAIDAQVASSLATINFIKTVGLEPYSDAANETRQKVRMVDFSYTTLGTPATANTDAIASVDKKITVPLLAIVPIPSLRIEAVDINFNAKLNSIQTEDITSKIDVGLEANGGFGPVKFKVTAAYQRSSTTGFKVEKEYTLNVKVRAVQDEIPAGLEKGIRHAFSTIAPTTITTAY